MMHVCAWCDHSIGTHAGQLRGRPTRNFGMCADCLRERLNSLPARLGDRELKLARRMQKSGQSMNQIGRVLGVSQPTVQAALPAA